MDLHNWVVLERSLSNHNHTPGEGHQAGDELARIVVVRYLADLAELN